MIRIMHIFSTFDVGGLESVVANLINHMSADMFSHSICVFSKRTGAVEKIKNKNINIFIVRKNFRNDPTLIFRLAGLLKRQKPDIVRTYNWGAIEGVVASKLGGVKRIVHSEHGFDLAEVLKQKKRRIFARKLILKRCDKIIAVSKFLQKWLVETVGVDNNKVIYLPNGCDVKKYFPGRDGAKRRELDIQDNEIVIGTVGSLKELKDQESLIKAFASLTKSYADLKLLLVGDGPKRKDLEDFARELKISDKVIFAGNIIDTADIYRAMDIFVLPSLSENLPNTLLEAMASGLPVVATDVGDVRYILDGENGGIIVQPKDVEGIAKGIEYYLNNKQAAKDKGNFARRRVEEFFSLDKMVNAYESLYLAIMKEKAKQ